MRTTGGALNLNPDHEWIFCLEKYELAFEKHELEKIIDQWNEGASIEFIAKQQRRPWEEIFLALFDQASRGKKLRSFATEIKRVKQREVN